MACSIKLSSSTWKIWDRKLLTSILTSMNSENMVKYHFFTLIQLFIVNQICFHIYCYHISHSLIKTYISDLQFDLPLIITSEKVKIFNQWNRSSNHRYFLVFRIHSNPFFDLRWSKRLWPPKFAYLLTRRAKYKIIENTLCEVSNHRFFGIPIPFWVTSLT